MPQNIDKLTRFLAKEWEVISQKTINNLVASMKNRCESVLAKNRDKILY